MPEDTRDIVISLRAEFQAHRDESRRDAAKMNGEIRDLKVSVEELTALLNKARGAKWAILTAAAIGGFISAKLAWILPLPWGR